MGNSGSEEVGALARCGSNAYVHGDTRHGRRTPEYRAWNHMRGRCYDPNDPDYLRYGGRGIAICTRWEDYVLFLHDMGRRPSKLHTLDRIDVDKGYDKANCRWATRKEQSRNRAHCIGIEAAIEIRRLYATGEYTQTQLATRYGIKQTTVSQIVLGKSWT
jgi:DNA-binding XRE family transcriptional regulator